MRNSVLLAFILLLAFYMAFIPHIGYAYPLHVDEWMHMTYAETIAQTGSITFLDPFTGLTDIKLGGNLWVGYHTFWAIFQQVSGLDWIILFRYFPSIIFMITVLAVYVLASRQGYGLEAAFFTCLIPTTGGLLGPAFMVPMALAILFIPLSLFLAYNIKKWPSYLLIFLFTSFLLISHATTAIVLCIIVTPYILLNIRNNRWHCAGVLAAMVLPFALSLPWTFQIAARTARQLLVPQYMSPYVQLPELLWKYGLLPIAFSFLGTIILIIKGNKKGLAMILGLALLLVVMVVFIRFHYGLSMIYERGLTVMLLILSILAGAGLFWLRNLKMYNSFFKKYTSQVFVKAMPLACSLIVCLILAIAVPTRLNAIYYHMIDNEDYRAFIWIKEYVPLNYDRALLDPWKATAFTAITGKKAPRRIWITQETADDTIYHVLDTQCISTEFLAENRVSFIYNRSNCINKDLVEVRKHIYISNPNISKFFPRAEGLQNAGFEAVYGNPPASWYPFSRNSKQDFLYFEVGRKTDWCIGIKMHPSIAPPAQASDAMWGQDVTILAGKSYVIGGWIKTEDIVGEGGARILLLWKRPDHTWISNTILMKFLKGTNGWAYYEGSGYAPAGSTICTVTCLMSDCTGTAWFDDIDFKEK